MISSNVAGYTKKQLTAAVVFIGFCVGNIAGPQTFITSEAREFYPPSANLSSQSLLRFFDTYADNMLSWL